MSNTYTIRPVDEETGKRTVFYNGDLVGYLVHTDDIRLRVVDGMFWSAHVRVVELFKTLAKGSFNIPWGYEISIDTI